MSGSGGYYKYRCKYWLTYNCPNWVWVNNAPCANCLADGRESDILMMSSPFRISRQVYVPQLENGALYYTIVEIVAANDADSGWSVKDIPVQPFPSETGPSAVGFTAVDEISNQKRPYTGLRDQLDGKNWSKTGGILE